MLEMNEKLAKMEEDLALALTDLASTKDGLAATRDDLAKALNNLATKDDLATTKTTLMELELEVTTVREPPFIHACGSHYDGLTIKSQTIPYSSLLYSSTNMPGVGRLDTETGVFTAPHPGSNTLPWSTQASDDAGDHFVEIYLCKNGQSIQEAHHYSYYSGPSGWVTDQGKYYSVISDIYYY